MRTQKFHFQAYIEMYEDDMSNVRKMIAEVQNRANLSYYEAVAQVFIWGIEVGAKQLEEGDTKRGINEFLLNRQLADALEREAGYNKRIFAAVRELGETKALEVALREGMEEKAVMELIEKARPKEGTSPLRVRQELWLIDYMKGRKGVRVERIKRDAMEAGVLTKDDPDLFKKDWAMLRGVASEKGYSAGRRGIWSDVDGKGE